MDQSAFILRTSALLLVLACVTCSGLSWGQWSRFSACSKSCVQSRSRVCDSPNPEGLAAANYCVGPGTMVEACNTGSCPGDGSWGQWTSFSACSKSCGGGVRSRTRECDRPTRGGVPYGDCEGLGTMAEACNSGRCPGIETVQRNVTVGDTFSMSCMGGGNHWWKHIKATNDRHVITRGLDTSALEITSVELSDAGDYYCGQSKKIEVTVLGAGADAGAKDVGHILDKAVADIMGAVKAIIKTLKTVASENEVVYRLVVGAVERGRLPAPDSNEVRITAEHYIHEALSEALYP